MHLRLLNARGALLLALTCLSALPLGCAACDDIGVTSVILTITDDGGNAIEGASASYTVDGGAEVPCEAMGEGFWCGVEVEGSFVITAEAAGYESASTMISVDADQCHVMTEEVDLVLQATP